jgi:transposase InsO family protein
MDERVKFIASCREGSESVSELCRRFGISRKTGNKWLVRYRCEGAVGLQDRVRAPRSNPAWLEAGVSAAVLEVRHRHPSWGPRKVKAWLEEHCLSRDWPAASTIGSLFDRAGLTRPRRRRRRFAVHGAPLAHCRGPNDLWCVDFKGWFLTGDGTHVEPLTLSDAWSRYLLCCEPVGSVSEAAVWPLLERAFCDHGLPRALRSDNGPPFASAAAGGLSRLAIKLIKAGVLPERIEPGKPQQNGRLERLHLTLKQDTASPPARSLAEQLERFERFQEIYNHERPHEALDQKPPCKAWRPSPRQYEGILREPDYPAEAEVRRVRHNGTIKWQGEHLFVSEVLKGEPVGIYALDEDVHLVRYAHVVLGTINGKQGLRRAGAAVWGRARAPQNEPGKLSPMLPG